MKNLNEIIFEVMDAVVETRLNVNPDMILDCSTRIFNNQTNQNRFKTQEKKTNLPTQKQLDFLKNNGVLKEVTTREEATELISKIINKVK